jgi:GntR family transcriptional regulator
VIEFVLDGRSKVNTYMQLVQQVKQALRVGLLEPGDQLPKVRDVAQSLAINPNTVLKAYRELEIEGLVGGRPGVGTFVLRTLAGASLSRQAQLRDELVGWLGRAQDAGLSAEDVVALVDTTIRARLADGVPKDSAAKDGVAKDGSAPGNSSKTSTRQGESM